MRGPYFDSQIQRIASDLPQSVSVEDVELMYTLLLEARGINSQVDLTESEEKFALGAFCWFHWPNKLAKYKQPARTVASHFGGISRNEHLVGKFRARISQRFIAADVNKAVAGEAGIDHVNDIFKKVTTHAMRRSARRFRSAARVDGS